VRVVGELIRMPDEAELSAAKVRELAFSILSVRQQQRFEADNELDTSHAMGSKVRFRVNLFVQRNAVGAAFRVIPYDVVPFDQLGVPEIIKTWADLPRGLVLVTGPTGSGKSTTLASLIDIVNRTRQCHIITIEDPVEFVHRPKVALVNQREVGEDTAGFGRALTQAMRQDPDVILVGEMRDLDTISTAITAAETGHLVFGTLHTQDAAQTVDRIIDVFPGEQQGQVRIQLANSLVGVSTQQLVPTADGRSRAVACEIMMANTAIRSLIRDGKVHQIHNAMASGKRQGMQSMDDSLADLVRRGVVTLEAAIRRAQNPDDLARMVALTPKS
jgi:twitching motility protein PilT